MSIEDIAFELKELRQQRLLIQKKEEELKKAVMDYLVATGEPKVCGIGCKEVTSYTVSDWNKVQEYIKDTGHFDLIQKRISKSEALKIKDPNTAGLGLKTSLSLVFNKEE